MGRQFPTEFSNLHTLLILTFPLPLGAVDVARKIVVVGPATTLGTITTITASTILMVVIEVNFHGHLIKTLFLVVVTGAELDIFHLNVLTEIPIQ